MMYETYGTDPLLIIALLIIFIYFFFVALYLRGSKSKRYRELLADMYVVGVIKQLAEKDKIDLHKELVEFDRIIKKSNLRTKGLSQVVEEELKEKVAEVQEKSLSKK